MVKCGMVLDLMSGRESNDDRVQIQDRIRPGPPDVSDIPAPRQVISEIVSCESSVPERGFQTVDDVAGRHPLGVWA